VHLRVVANRDFGCYGAQSPEAACFPQPTSHHRDERLSNNLYSLREESVAAPAKTISAAERGKFRVSTTAQPLKALYTSEQRRRRDATKWTLVQGILAPIQFAVFLVSLFLVARYLTTGEGFAAATSSIVLKTLLLYAIMVTGSIWEREVFGCFLGRRFQLPRAGLAHSLPGRAIRRLRHSAPADAARTGRLRIVLHQRNPVHLEAARRTPG
jgi:uncharacterized membrane protein (GlpM family)